MSKRANASHAHGSSMPAIHDGRRGAVGDESSFSRFMNEQIWAQDKLAGNINILVGAGFFAASIMATRLWGHFLLVPSAP